MPQALRPRLEEFRDKAKKLKGEATKFRRYQLPGGENYKELLLKLPAPAPDMDAEANACEAFDRGEIDRDERNRRIDAAMSALESTYKSPHFDQLNILAHIRFNERTDAEGKKVLFLEELQSDWGQESKKKGFHDEAIIRRNLATLRLAEQHLLDAAKEYTDKGKDAPASMIESHVSITEKIRKLELTRVIPSAPFVTDTKVWSALALKRMITYAAEHGFDKISWTNGEQQAERYDLSKKIDRLYYKKNADGTYRG